MEGGGGVRLKLKKANKLQAKKLICLTSLFFTVNLNQLLVVFLLSSKGGKTTMVATEEDEARDLKRRRQIVRDRAEAEEHGGTATSRGVRILVLSRPKPDDVVVEDSD